MKPEELYDLLKESPFRPKRLHLQDGRTCEIPRRDMVVVGTTYVDVGIQAQDEAPGICSRIVTFAPQEVIRVETLSSTPHACN